MKKHAWERGLRAHVAGITDTENAAFIPHVVKLLREMATDLENRVVDVAVRIDDGSKPDEMLFNIEWKWIPAEFLK